jgi:hypothetical protein
MIASATFVTEVDVSMCIRRLCHPVIQVTMASLTWLGFSK